MSTRIPSLVARFGFKRFLIIGPLIAIAGMVWLSFIPVNGSYFINLLPAFVLIPLGMGMTFMPVIVAATSGVPAHEAGLASGLITTSQQMGGALGLSILSGIAASVTSAATSDGAQAALVVGFDRAIIAAAAFMLIAVILGAILIEQPKDRQGIEEAAQRASEAVI
jgi:MFS family permease